jgi:hypothetical protein
MTIGYIFTFALGATVSGIGSGIALYLNTYIKHRAENAAKHADYPARYSEETNSRQAEYYERLLFDKFESLISVRIRLGEIVAELEKRLPTPPEDKEIEKELETIAVEMRALGHKLYLHSGLYDDDIRNKMNLIVTRLRRLAASTENLASQVYVENEDQEECMKENLAVLKEQLDTFGTDLVSLVKTFKKASTIQALEKQDQKRLT